MPDLNLSSIRHALSVAREGGFKEVEVEVDGVEFEARLGAKRAPVRVRESEPKVVSEPEDSLPALSDITCGLVGYFKVGNPPLQLAQQLNVGDVVGTVVALGIPNDVEARFSGEVVEVLVSDGQPVEYGQVLARVRSET